MALQDDYRDVKFYADNSKDVKEGFASFKEEGEFYFSFKVNDEVYLLSEGYSSDRARNNGINSVEKNIKNKDRFKMMDPIGGKHYFVLRAGNNQEIAKSINFNSAGDAEAAITLLSSGGGSGLNMASISIDKPLPPKEKEEKKKRKKRSTTKKPAPEKTILQEGKYPIGGISYQIFRSSNEKHYFTFRTPEDKAVLLNANVSGFKTLDEAKTRVEEVLKYGLIEKNYEGKTTRNGKYYFYLKNSENKSIAKSFFFDTAEDMQIAVASLCSNQGTGVSQNIGDAAKSTSGVAANSSDSSSTTKSSSADEANKKAELEKLNAEAKQKEEIRIAELNKVKEEKANAKAELERVKLEQEKKAQQTSNSNVENADESQLNVAANENKPTSSDSAADDLMATLGLKNKTAAANDEQNATLKAEAEAKLNAEKEAKQAEDAKKAEIEKQAKEAEAAKKLEAEKAAKEAEAKKAEAEKEASAKKIEEEKAAEAAKKLEAEKAAKEAEKIAAEKEAAAKKIEEEKAAKELEAKKSAAEKEAAAKKLEEEKAAKIAAAEKAEADRKLQESELFKAEAKRKEAAAKLKAESEAANKSKEQELTIASKNNEVLGGVKDNEEEISPGKKPLVFGNSSKSSEPLVFGNENKSSEPLVFGDKSTSNKNEPLTFGKQEASKSLEFGNANSTTTAAADATTQAVESTKRKFPWWILPLLLIPLLLLFLWRGCFTGAAEKGVVAAKETTKNVTKAAGDKAVAAKDKIVENTNAVTNKVADATKAAKNTVSNTANKVKETTRSTVEKANNTVTNTAPAATSTINNNAVSSVSQFESGTIEYAINNCIKDSNCNTPASLNWGETNYGKNSARMNSAATGSIKNLALLMSSYPNATLAIYGHISNNESDYIENSSTSLSERRAKKMYDMLVANGVSSSRLSYQGMGNSNPLAYEDSANAHYKNRRTEVVLTSK